jgi:hypothetical protein
MWIAYFRSLAYFGWTFQSNKNWLVFLFCFCFVSFWSNFVCPYFHSVNPKGFFRLELFMSTGSRDKFFVGHLIAWYFHEMLYRLWKKSINQRRSNQAKRGNRVSMFKTCDLNRVISKLWKYKQTTTEKWNDDISITIRLASSQKASQHFSWWTRLVSPPQGILLHSCYTCRKNELWRKKKKLKKN